MLNPMNDQRSQPDPDDYVLLPSVTHPGGREMAFKDAFKAMARSMIETNDNPTIAYPIGKTVECHNAERLLIDGASAQRASLYL